jgi:hypothetical protein
LIGRRPSGVLLSFGAALSLALARYYHDVSVGGVSMFFVILLGQRFFGDGGYAVVGPYAAEVWPSRLRASGMGFGFGIGNLGKILGPLGLALIVGSSDVISPKATIAAIEPAMVYLAAWYALSGIVFILLGFETRGRLPRRTRRHDRQAAWCRGSAGLGAAIVVRRALPPKSGKAHLITALPRLVELERLGGQQPLEITALRDCGPPSPTSRLPYRAARTEVGLRPVCDS